MKNAFLKSFVGMVALCVAVFATTASASSSLEGSTITMSASLDSIGQNLKEQDADQIRGGAYVSASLAALLNFPLGTTSMTGSTLPNTGPDTANPVAVTAGTVVASPANPGPATTTTVAGMATLQPLSVVAKTYTTSAATASTAGTNPASASTSSTVSVTVNVGTALSAADAAARAILRGAACDLNPAQPMCSSAQPAASTTTASVTSPVPVVTPPTPVVDPAATQPPAPVVTPPVPVADPAVVSAPVVNQPAAPSATPGPVANPPSGGVAVVRMVVRPHNLLGRTRALGLPLALRLGNQGAI